MPSLPDQARSEERPLDIGMVLRTCHGNGETRGSRPSRSRLPQERVEMSAENVGLAQLLSVAGAEQRTRLGVTDELNQQLRHVLREVCFTFPIFRLEVIVYFAVPLVLINDDASTTVANLLDADTPRFTDAETARATEYEKHSHLRLDG